MLEAALKAIADVLPWQHGHRRQFVHNFLLQIYFTFVQSLTMVSVIGLAAGVAVSFQTQFGLALLGNNDQIGKVVVFILFRELVPIMAALLLIARSVTSVAAEMATSKFQQETEALNIMGISIYHYLLAPRIASGMVSLFCMATTMWGFALLGGWIGANFGDYFPVTQYLTSVSNALRPADFLFFPIKTFAVGGVVLWIGCQRGLSLQAAPYEIPIVTNRAVVDALTVALGVHMMLSTSYYILFGLDL